MRLRHTAQGPLTHCRPLDGWLFLYPHCRLSYFIRVLFFIPTIPFFFFLPPNRRPSMAHLRILRCFGFSNSAREVLINIRATSRPTFVRWLRDVILSPDSFFPDSNKMISYMLSVWIPPIKVVSWFRAYTPAALLRTYYQVINRT